MDKTLCKLAVVQAAPILFDWYASLEKAKNLVCEAAEEGAQLIVFPEAFLPGYPRGFSFGTTIGHRRPEGRKLWRLYQQACHAVPGPAIQSLAELAAKRQVWIVIGVVEKSKTGSLYCSMLFLNPAGELCHHHRKIKPTAAERLIWAEGDGRSLHAVDTEWGPMGGLICWENYMPAARMKLYQDGVGIYLAPTADQRLSWQASMQHIACEGRTFVIGCNQYVEKSMYPADMLAMESLAGMSEILCRGGSVVVSPLGEILAGPLFDQEGIIYADLDMNLVQEARLDLDVSGHYDRPDLFGQA
ncbi:MAG: carbon-nitrogen hydrolase family protein [Bacteroidota bacterium]